MVTKTSLLVSFKFGEVDTVITNERKKERKKEKLAGFQPVWKVPSDFWEETTNLIFRSTLHNLALYSLGTRSEFIQDLMSMSTAQEISVHSWFFPYSPLFSSYVSPLGRLFLWVSRKFHSIFWMISQKHDSFPFSSQVKILSFVYFWKSAHGCVSLLYLFCVSVRYWICMRTARAFIVTQSWPARFSLSLNKINKGIGCYQIQSYCMPATIITNIQKD